MTSQSNRVLGTAAMVFALLPATIGWVGCGDDDTDEHENCAWVARSELRADDVIVRWTQPPTHGLPDQPDLAPVLDPDWTATPARVHDIPGLERFNPKVAPRRVAKPGKSGAPGGSDGEWACIVVE